MIFYKLGINMSNDINGNDVDFDVKLDVKYSFENLLKTHERLMLMKCNINELTSGATLLNVVCLFDGKRFVGPFEANRFGKFGIVWFKPSPDGQHSFDCQLCTAIGSKPELKDGKEEVLSTDKYNLARKELLKTIHESPIEKRAKPRQSYALVENISLHIEGVTSECVCVCIIACYNIGPTALTTLLAYHPCVSPELALEVWQSQFDY